MVKPSGLRNPPSNLLGVFQPAREQMTTFKTSYKSVATLVDSEGKPLKFDLAKAKLFVTPEKGVVREVEISGQFCPLFVIESSKTTAVIGINLRGLTIEGSNSRLTKLEPSAPKASVPELRPDPNELFQVESDLE